MALDTFDDLKAAVQSWMFERSDLATNVEEFITLAEADFNDVLRTREMRTSSDLVFDSGAGTYPLPDDYLETYAASPTDSIPLDMVDADFITTQEYIRASGTPRWFYIDGDGITVNPGATSDLRFVYYRKIPALSASNQTNWLLSRRPGAYLFLSCAYGATFIGDDGRAQQMFGLAGNEIEKLAGADARTRWSKSARSVRGIRP